MYAGKDATQEFEMLVRTLMNIFLEDESNFQYTITAQARYHCEVWQGIQAWSSRAMSRFRHFSIFLFFKRTISVFIIISSLLGCHDLSDHTTLNR